MVPGVRLGIPRGAWLRIPRERLRLPGLRLGIPRRWLRVPMMRLGMARGEAQDREGRGSEC